jgi:hypothetical protein
MQAVQPRRYAFALPGKSCKRTVRAATVLAICGLLLGTFSGLASPAQRSIDSTSDPAAGPDITTLYLDSYGADIPEGNWWGKVEIAAGVESGNGDTGKGPDITTLNLDHEGSDVGLP